MNPFHCRHGINTDHMSDKIIKVLICDADIECCIQQRTDR